MNATRLALAVVLVIAADARAQSARRPNNSGRRTQLDRLLEESRGAEPGRTTPDADVTLGAGSGVAEWEFPQSPDRWINSPPLTRESLAGKGVVLVFYEEECPQCASRWPDLLRLAGEYRDQPLLFVAVNSGSTARDVAGYARTQRIAWPVIADLDRSFEAALGVPSVSLGNVIQAAYITADGVAHRGKWSDLRATADAALRGAAWKVPPPAPRELERAWRSVELGAYADAAKAVLRYAEAGKEGTAVKSFADKLLAAVNEAIKTDYDAAIDAYRDGEHWAAYKALAGMTQRYDGFTLPEGVANGVERLEERDDVAEQIDARKALDKAVRTASRGSEAAIRRGLGMLERIVSDSPGTEAADEAQKILAQYNR